MPYIITDQELRTLFAECDREPFCKQSPCRHLIIPVIFRLIYCCGLRPNEGRELKRADFNEAEGTLFIRKNKSHRERLLPLSDDVAVMCRNYLSDSRKVYPDTEYMFPSPDGDSYNRKWLSETFRRLWNASNPGSKAKKIRVYLLRHRFATAVFMKWLDEKSDIYAKMPYLSTYMGHTQFEDTAYRVKHVELSYVFYVIQISTLDTRIVHLVHECIGSDIFDGLKQLYSSNRKSISNI